VQSAAGVAVQFIFHRFIRKTVDVENSRGAKSAREQLISFLSPASNPARGKGYTIHNPHGMVRNELGRRK